MKIAVLFTSLALLLSLIACSNPGKDCCDCLIGNSCWTSEDYACYYYYDEGYMGEEESPPPAQSWTIACAEDHCADICKQVDGVMD